MSIEVEPNNTPATASTATFGDSASGRLETKTDIDHFRLYADAGGEVVIDFVHPGSQGNNSRPLVLRLEDGDGKLINSKQFNASGRLEATVPQPGEYVLVVSNGQPNATQWEDGQYSFTARLDSSSGDAYDGGGNNTLESALGTAADGVTPIKPGASLHGSLGHNADEDFFRIEVDSGGALLLDFKHPAGSVSNGLKMRLEVLDSEGRLIAGKDFSGSGKLETTVPQAGQYLVRVKDVQAGTVSWAEGLYRVDTRFDHQASDAYDGGGTQSPETAVSTLADGVTPIKPGASLHGSLGNNADEDFFRIEVDSGGALLLDFKHPAGSVSNGLKMRLEVLDSEGQLIAGKDFFGSGKLETTVSQAGQYFVRVKDIQIGTVSWAEGLYRIDTRLVHQASDAYDGGGTQSPETAVSTLADGVTPIKPGASLHGSLGNNADEDFFRIEVDSGGALLLDFKHPAGSVSNGLKMRLEVLDSEGQLIAGKDFFGSGKLETTVSQAGQYFVRVKDIQAGTVSWAEGLYRIDTRLVHQASDAYDGGGTQSPETAVSTLADGVTPIKPGAMLHGSLGHNADDDYFRIEVDSGGALLLDFKHPAGSVSNGLRMRLEVLDSEGQLIAGKDFSGSGTLEAAVPQAGQYFVRVKDIQAGTVSWAEGVYTVSTSLLKDDGTVDGPAEEPGPELFHGSSADDLFVLGSTSSVIDGGDGIDMVRVEAFAGDYVLINNGDSFLLQGRPGSGLASHELFNVERVLFDDKAFALDIDGIGGQAYRIYQAAFARTPDKEGVGFWMKYLVQPNLGLADAAQGFIESAEFAATYGTGLSDEDFINLLYLNVLQREADQDGFDFWKKFLAVPDLGHADLLREFSESAENQALTIGAIKNGFEYVDWS